MELTGKLHGLYHHSILRHAKYDLHHISNKTNMESKANSYVRKTENRVLKSEKMSVTQQAESVLKIAKEKAGKVVHIVINNRTTIELPAYLSQDEIDARVEKYIRLHQLKV
jgi:hypothetical protein